MEPSVRRVRVGRLNPNLFWNSLGGTQIMLAELMEQREPQKRLVYRERQK
jgi:hypothetical protein